MCFDIGNIGFQKLTSDAVDIRYKIIGLLRMT